MKNTITPAEVRVNWSRARTGGPRSYIDHQVDEGVRIGFTESHQCTAAIAIPMDLRDELPDGILGEGLEAIRGSFQLGGAQQNCLVLSCSSTELERVFSEFVAALLERLKDGQPPISAIVAVVKDYRALLRRQRPSAISRETAMGLAGELLVLKTMSGIFREAWKTWNGPLGMVHDFVSGQMAIEVKTTSHETEPSFEVANVAQLYPLESGELFIVHHVLIPNPRGGVTVSTLAEEIRSALAEPAGLDERLEAVGFLRSTSEAWDEHVFQLAHTAIYRVEEGFPRMPRNILDSAPAGVSDLRYRVHLSQAAAFRLRDGSEVDHVFAKMRI